MGKITGTFDRSNGMTMAEAIQITDASGFAKRAREIAATAPPFTEPQRCLFRAMLSGIDRRAGIVAAQSIAA